MILYTLTGALLVGTVLLAARWFVENDAARIAQSFKMILTGLALVALLFFLFSGRFVIFLIGLTSLAPLFPSLIKGWDATSAPLSPPSSLGQCTPEQARAILGVPENATISQIRAAHKAMIQKVHPDQGGSDYLASQVNQAKDVLLKKK